MNKKKIFKTLLKNLLFILSLIGVNQAQAQNLNIVLTAPPLPSINSTQSYSFKISNPLTSVTTYSNYQCKISLPSASVASAPAINFVGSSSPIVSASVAPGHVTVDCSSFAPGEEIQLNMNLSYGCTFYTINGINAGNAGLPFQSVFSTTMTSSGTALNFTMNNPPTLPATIGNFSVATKFPYLVDISNELSASPGPNAHRLTLLPNMNGTAYHVKYHAYKNIGTDSYTGGATYEDIYTHTGTFPFTVVPASSRILIANNTFTPSSLNVLLSSAPLSAAGITPITGTTPTWNTVNATTRRFRWQRATPFTISINEFLIFEERITTTSSICMQNDVSSNSTLTIAPNFCATGISVPNGNVYPDILNNVKVTTSNNILCAGDKAVINVSGANVYAYRILPSATLISLPAGVTSFTVSPTSTTSYEIQGTQGSGCTAKTNITVVVNPTPIASIASIPAIAQLCLPIGSNSVQLYTTVAGGSAPYTYSWSSNPTGFSNSSSAVNVSPTVKTNYQVQITDSKGCSALANKDVMIENKPDVIVTPISYCLGSNDPMVATLLTPSLNNTVTFKWTNPLSVATLSPIIVPTMDGNYTIETIAGNCTATQNIVVKPAINALLISPSAVDICLGSSTTITFNLSGSLTNQYSCDLVNSLGITIATYTGPSNANFVVTPTSPEVYCLKNIVDAGPGSSGCKAVSPPCVSVNMSPELSAFIGNSNLCCTGGPFVLPISFTGTPPFTFDIVEMIGGLPSILTAGATCSSNSCSYTITPNCIASNITLQNLQNTNCISNKVIGNITIIPPSACPIVSGGGLICEEIQLQGSASMCKNATPNLEFVHTAAGLIGGGIYNLLISYYDQNGFPLGIFPISYSIPPSSSSPYSVLLPSPMGPLTQNTYIEIQSVVVTGTCPISDVVYGGTVAHAVFFEPVGMLIPNTPNLCLPANANFTVVAASSSSTATYNYQVKNVTVGSLVNSSLGVGAVSNFSTLIFPPFTPGGLNDYQLTKLENTNEQCLVSTLNIASVQTEGPITTNLTPGSISVCKGSSVVLSGTLSGLLPLPSTQNISVIFNDGSIAPVVIGSGGVGSFSTNIIANTNNVYSIVGVTGLHICTSTVTANTYSVNIISPPVLAINTPSNICVGPPIVLTATGAASNYIWTEGLTTLGTGNSISLVFANTVPRIITLTGINAGCATTSSVSVTLTAKDVPLPPCPINMLNLGGGNLQFSIPNTNDGIVWSLFPSSDFYVHSGLGSNEIIVRQSPGSTAIAGRAEVYLTNSCGSSLPCSVSFIIGGCSHVSNPLPTWLASTGTRTFTTLTDWHIFLTNAISLAPMGTVPTVVVSGTLTLNLPSLGSTILLNPFAPSNLNFIMEPGSEIVFTTPSTTGLNWDISNCSFKGDCEMWRGLRYANSNINLTMNDCEISDALYAVNVSQPVNNSLLVTESTFRNNRFGLTFGSSTNISAIHNINVEDCVFTADLNSGARVPLLPTTSTYISIPLITGTGPNYPYYGINSLSTITGGNGWFGKGAPSSPPFTTSNYKIKGTTFSNLECGIFEAVATAISTNQYDIIVDECVFSNMFLRGTSNANPDGSGIRLLENQLLTVSKSDFSNIPNYAVRTLSYQARVESCDFNNINYNFITSQPIDFAAIALTLRNGGPSISTVSSATGISNMINGSSLPGFRAIYNVVIPITGNFASTPVQAVTKNVHINNVNINNYQRGIYARGINEPGIHDNTIGLTTVARITTNNNRYGINAYLCSQGNIVSAGPFGIKRNTIQCYLGTNATISGTNTISFPGIIAGDNFGGTVPSPTNNQIEVSENFIYGLPQGIQIQGFINNGLLTCNRMENCFNGIRFTGHATTPNNVFCLPSNPQDLLGNRWVRNTSASNGVPGITLNNKVIFVTGNTLATGSNVNWEYNTTLGATGIEYQPNANYTGTTFGSACNAPSTCTLGGLTYTISSGLPACIVPRQAQENNIEVMEDKIINAYPTMIYPGSKIFVQGVNNKDQIKIINMNGQKIAQYEASMDGEFIISNTHSLAQGMYILIVSSSESGQKASIKFVVQ